jgi:hypothetical protein
MLGGGDITTRGQGDRTTAVVDPMGSLRIAGGLGRVGCEAAVPSLGLGGWGFSVGRRHAVVFHFVSEGHAWLRIEDAEPIELAAAVPSLRSRLADLGGRPGAPHRRDEKANRNQFTERADSADHRQRTETYSCRT